jgi:hypothetical protein
MIESAPCATSSTRLLNSRSSYWSVPLPCAERLIESCEGCDADAEIPFDTILDRVTGSDPSVTDYVLEEPAKCPYCKREILEKTLIEPA